MKSTEHWLVHDHTKIEYMLGRLCESAEINDWASSGKALRELVDNLKFHIALEEEVLFPAFEARTSSPHLPTESLSSEHTRIIQLLCELADIIESRNPIHMRETLPLLEAALLEHHGKEENIFLPMASHILFAEREQLSEKLNSFSEPQHPRDWSI